MFFIHFLVIHGTAISRKAPGGSLWIKDYIYLFFVCRGQCYNSFLSGDCVALFVFLGNYECERDFREKWRTYRETVRKAVKPCDTRELRVERYASSGTLRKEIIIFWMCSTGFQHWRAIAKKIIRFENATFHYIFSRRVRLEIIY